MRILVLSDSHGRNYGMFSVVDKHYSEINAVIHLGDLVSDAEELVRKYPYLPVCTVAGNCDLYGFSKDDYEKTVEYGGVKIFMCHGHTCGVKGSLGLLRSKAEQNGAKIALFGHTHLPLVEEKGGIILMNPGSISEPRDGRAPSYGMVEIENGEVVSCKTLRRWG